MDVINWILANWMEMLGAFQATMLAVIAVSALIPGKEPEKTLQKIVDFVKQFSKK